MIHRSGMPRGVSQTVLKCTFRSLRQTRLGALSRNPNSQASNHEIGSESSQPSHCASDNLSRYRLVRAVGTIRLATVGASPFIWPYSPGIFATVSLETSQIFPES